MNPQPMITVHYVPASSRWYQAVLGLQSGHGGPEYEQLVFEGRTVLQLHHWGAHEHPHEHSHEHPHLGDPALRPYGNGAVLWFQTDAFDAAMARVRAHGAQVLEGPRVNPNAHHREVWLRDPDGYVVVVASAYGDLGGLA